MRIVVADDDIIALTVLTEALVAAGHEVIETRDGVEALEALDHRAARVLITDWVMPRLDGLGLCEAIRARDIPGYIYIILLTSRNVPSDIIAGLSAGADDFLTKPFHPGELSARLRTAERVLSLETRDVAIFAMARLAESRDPETGRHLERIRSYSAVVAEELKASSHEECNSDDYVKLIQLTSPLHDIGKVGIPDSVLLKPGRLNDREFEIMKTHTSIGAETLDSAAREFPGVHYLSMARDIAWTHHERFDGTGYPRGLAAHQIPLSGRIVAVADVYDALTSKRVYKDAFSHDVATALILQDSGTHFDPEVVEAFSARQVDFDRIREGFQEAREVPV